MAREWKTERLSALCEKIADCPHSTPLWTESGVVVLRSQNIRGGRLDLSNPSYTDEAHFEQRSRRARLRGGDLVLTREAPMGEVCMVPDGLRCCLGQRMVMLRPDPVKCESRFLLYAIQSNAVQHEIRVNEGTGSTVSNLRIPLLEALPIPHPPLAEQKRIAQILGTLDDKIELNRRMNATIEAMARALYQSWFVDASEEGVKESALGDLVSFARKAISPASFPDEGFDHYSLPAFDAGKLPAKDRGISIKSNKTLVPADAILLSKLNPRIPRVWLPDVGKGSRSIASTEFLVVQPNKTVTREFLFGLFTSPAFLQTLEGMVTGTSGSHQRVKPDSVLRIPVSLPPASVIEHFTVAVAPMLRKAQANIQESRCLADLRDTLLPKLLSGEVTTSSIPDL